jgi:hypothetical protein
VPSRSVSNTFTVPPSGTVTMRIAHASGYGAECTRVVRACARAWMPAETRQTRRKQAARVRKKRWCVRINSACPVQAPLPRRKAVCTTCSVAEAPRAEAPPPLRSFYICFVIGVWGKCVLLWMLASAVGARKCCGCSQVLWVLASAVGARKCCGCSQVLWVLESAVGARKCCGCSQVLWVLASAVGARKCCGCSQVLWVLASAVGARKCCGCSQVLVATPCGPGFLGITSW